MYAKFASVVFDVWCTFALEPPVLTGSHWTENSMEIQIQPELVTMRFNYAHLGFNQTCLLPAV